MTGTEYRARYTHWRVVTSGGSVSGMLPLRTIFLLEINLQVKFL